MQFDGLYTMPEHVEESPKIPATVEDSTNPSSSAETQGSTSTGTCKSIAMAKPSSVIQSTTAVQSANPVVPMPIIAQPTPAIDFSAAGGPTPVAGPAKRPASRPIPTKNPNPQPTSDIHLVSLKSCAPAWIVEGYAHLTECNLGPAFIKCINIWVEFEEANGYESSQRKVSSTLHSRVSADFLLLAAPCQRAAGNLRCLGQARSPA
jgi:hypothetical protein